LSTIGSISFGIALVAGRNRVPSPPTGNTAFRTDLLFEEAPLTMPRIHGTAAGWWQPD
jgi:hypothetical protein